jgi:perosamine synthetase
MDQIKEIAKKRSLFVIEDAAHALPAYYKAKKVGTIADITCFSFYATKPLATGEGGMITTENPEWTDRQINLTA